MPAREPLPDAVKPCSWDQFCFDDLFEFDLVRLRKQQKEKGSQLGPPVERLE